MCVLTGVFVKVGEETRDGARNSAFTRQGSRDQYIRFILVEKLRPSYVHSHAFEDFRGLDEVPSLGSYCFRSSISLLTIIKQKNLPLCSS